MLTTNRRQFLAAAAASSVAGFSLAGEKSKPPKFKLGMVTYNVAAQWDLPTILKVCKEVGIAAVEVRLGRREPGAGGEWSSSSGPAGVLPLGLGGKPKAAGARGLSQTADVGLNVIISHRLNGAARAAGGKLAGIAAHELDPLALGDFVLAEVEAVRDFYLVRPFVALPARLRWIASHEEMPRRDEDELHPGQWLPPRARGVMLAVRHLRGPRAS